MYGYDERLSMTNNDNAPTQEENIGGYLIATSMLCLLIVLLVDSFK